MTSERIHARFNSEVVRYLLTGGISFSIDTSAYFLLACTGVLSPFWAKRISYVLGSIWAFFMNKHFTFRQNEFRIAEPFLFAIVYVFGFVLNGLLHDVVLHCTSSKLMAFAVASFVVICTNYVGQKLIVFRTKRAQNAGE